MGANALGMSIRPRRPLRSQPYKALFYIGGGGYNATRGLNSRELPKYLDVNFAEDFLLESSFISTDQSNSQNQFSYIQNSSKTFMYELIYEFL